MATKRITIDKNKCDQCGTCIAICHKNAIEMTDSPPVINEFICQLCLVCIQICPMGAIDLSVNQDKK